jgi:chromosome partitioning protein
VQTDAEVRDCRVYLSEAGYEVLPAFLPERPAYRVVQNRGLSVTEIRYKSLQAHGDALIQAIVDRISLNG